VPEADRELAGRIIAPSAPVSRYGQTVNEGFRFGCLGESGSGKTSLERLVAYSAIASGWSRFGLIHDTKGVLPEFRHTVQVPNVAAFLSRGGFKQGETPLVSFRGDPRRDVDCGVEEVAKYSLELAKKGREVQGVWVPNPHLFVVEEAAESASEGRKVISAPTALKLLEQGRKLGVSLMWTTQSPRKTPLDYPGQSSSIAFFRLTGADANYLAARMQLNADMVRAIRGPTGEGLPNFDYVLWVKGQPWDRLIHRLDKRTVDMFE
jgi:hypothetical protein